MSSAMATVKMRSCLAMRHLSLTKACSRPFDPSTRLSINASSFLSIAPEPVEGAADVQR
ncbi:MAG: hypothetical protein ACYTBP_17465 [Planctomycetota bacterium]